jgi:hypothetical protein
VPPPRFPARSPDTDAEAERVQIELLRAAGPERRLAMAFSLSATVLDLSRQGLRERHPTDSEDDIGLRLVELCHGRELAEAVRQHLRERRR